MTHPSDGSEFGGVPGLIQPPPHDIRDSAYETARIQRAVNPDDPEDSFEEALTREWELNGGVA